MWKDVLILTELRKNARAQLTDISKKTKIPISTIYDRLTNRSNSFILRHATLLRFDELGYNARANICIKCSKSSKKEVYENLGKHPNINSMYKINNGFDFMIEVIFKNVKDLEEFIEQLEDNYSIRQKEVYYIIDEILKENFFTSTLQVGNT